MLYRLMSFICLMFFLAMPSFAQEENDSLDTVIIEDTVIFDTDSTAEDIDTSFTDEDEAFDDFDIFEEHDIYIGPRGFHGNPTIELAYGFTENKLRSVSGSFYKNGSAALRLGYANNATFKKYIERYKFGYIFAGYTGQELRKKYSGLEDLEVNAWRFGLGSQEAYGYKIGKGSIIPYTSNSLTWTIINADLGRLSRLLGETPPVPFGTPFTSFALDDLKKIERFNDAVRFGTMTEGGIKLRLIPLISLNASYERAIVFPRYLVWKHLGSMAIELLGNAGLDMFVREVIDSSPAAGPIVNFLLKNGFSYALYQLRREKMNWPFNTEAPFTFDTFNFGLTLTF